MENDGECRLAFFFNFYHAMLRRARWCHIMASVRLFVHVTFTYRDLLIPVGWNTSKIISRMNSFLRYLLGLNPTSVIWSNGNAPPQIGWNRGGVRSAKKLQYIRNGARYDQGYYDRLIGSRTRTFDWYQNQWRWMTLNGRSGETHSCRNKFYGAHQKKLNEDRPILSAAKCRPMRILVSR